MKYYDFDYWANLARVDVDQFDKQKEYITRRNIHRLSGGDVHKEWVNNMLQIKRDNESKKFKNNFVLASNAFGHMLDSLNELNDAYKEM